ncbi:hypothetical protein N0V82_010661 [Gnomoniopsis sp. IMI 355080]|nr:hypothetical protein N0V82_010661 [Gnomoniopsis sp. IMI 355080]
MRTKVNFMGTVDIDVDNNACWPGRQLLIELENTTTETYPSSLDIDNQDHINGPQWPECFTFFGTQFYFDDYLAEPTDFDVKPLFRYEEDLRGGVKHNEALYTGIREIPQAQEIVDGTGKRTSTIAFADDQVGINGTRRKSMKTEAGNSEKQRQFACPFQKRDPVKHQDCLKLTLTRIKDVKQHLRRRHMQHKYYCPRCYDTFDNTRERDEHTRSSTCTTLEKVPAFEGISDDQITELSKCADRNLKVDLQWFNIWKIIFPDDPPPPSPFLGTYLNEMAPMLRDLWKIEGIGILESVLRQKAAEVNKVLVHEVIEAVFNRLEEGAGDSQLLTNKALKVQQSNVTRRETRQ